MRFDSPLSAFLHWESTTPDNLLFNQPFESGMKTYTYKEAGEEIRKIAAALKDLNYPAKSKIAMLSKNCAHWIMSDLAVQMAGHVTVPIYPTVNEKTIYEIVTHSESKAAIVGKLDDYPAQKEGLRDVLRIGVKAYGINEEESWENMVETHEPLTDTPDQTPDELLTIMYTSGTTGSPKGVMHKVGSFTLLANTAVETFNIQVKNPSFFSYLPLTHIAERVGIELYGLFVGGNFTFPLSLETFAQDLAATQPHSFFAVPRIWAKFQEGVLSKMPQKKLDTLLSIPIINNIVRKKIKAKLGLSRAVTIFSGAAPLALNVLEWYKKLGIEILQAYGMTEDCVLAHFNLPGANKLGTVGKPLPGLTAKLSPEGEILVKSECLMLGYYKEPEMTAEVFTEDGFLKTGDIGEYDHEGYLSITGRIKDQFKTDKGKYISPAPIEMQLTKNPDVELVCVVGMGIPQPIALVVASESGKQKGREAIAESLIQTVEALNPSLEKVEKIEKVVVMSEEWSIDNGLLTPTLKVKRNSVEKIHMPMYKAWFDSEEKVIFE
ncbi:MAG: AMP-binding protein [Cyclobacteriaceae bacterium]